MNLNQFAQKVSEKEGLKRPLTIAQIKEVLRCANDLTKDRTNPGGAVYKLIKELPKI